MQKRRKDSKEAGEFIKKLKEMKSLEELDIEEIARKDGWAEKLAEEWKEMKTHQLRRVFDEIKDIERKLKTESWDRIKPRFYMIRPYVAFAMNRNLVPKDFFKVIDRCMVKIDVGDEETKKRNYGRFVKLLEAIVAYHKG